MVSRRNRRKDRVPREPLAPKPANADAADTRRWRDWLPRLASGYPAAVAVLAVHFLVAAASVREKSNTYDEIAHVTAGFSYWTHHDYRLHPENGNLPQRWFALPLLTLDLKFPADPVAWDACDVWLMGDRFFFQSGNDLERMLWRARCMNALLSVGLGLLIYAWSRRLFGPGGGMISLLAYATDPTILANGSLATSDLAAAALFAASVGSLWRMFHKLSPGNFACSWLALAGLCLSKMSALLIVPMAVAMLGLRLLARRPLVVGWRRTVAVDGRLAQAGILLGALLLQAALVVTAIWAAYGFRYSAFQEPQPENGHFYQATWNDTLANTGAFGRAIEFARDRHLLPEAYLYGTAFVYQRSQQRLAFLNGQYGVTGWWYFFPYTFLVKTPLATFALLMLAAAGAVWSWRQGQPDRRRALRQSAWNALYATAPLWILLAIYWTSAIHAKLNIGHRHILPTYPALFILAGAAAYWLHQRGRWQWVMSAAVWACVLALAGECFATYPHYLAYFNSIAGGPANGYRHLVDSSLDWGQDLPGVQRWLKEHDLDGPGKTPVYLAYFGTGSPTYYGIRATQLCDLKPHALSPMTEGVYCISATCLQQVYTPTGGRWRDDYERTYREVLENVRVLQSADAETRSRLIESKGDAFWNQTFMLFDWLRLARLCAFLRQRAPDDNVGHSILIYRLTAADLQKALFGPPVELDTSPKPTAGRPSA
jgi:4-amino-4-deoxy-L-arabinose transferase-like glycosyltransferase